LIVFTSVDLFI